MLSFAGTYPKDEHYWVPPEDSDAYPHRYGDVFATPEGPPETRDSKDRPWHALMALHPSCELGAKGAPRGVHVARIHRLSAVSVPQRQEIRVGLKELDGRLKIVRANTVYLAPLPGSDVELFADLRDVARVSLDSLRAAGRQAAMTHDARLALLRRDIYFRYRWQLPLADLVALESARIRNDAAFAGPRPAWAE